MNLVCNNVSFGSNYDNSDCFRKNNESKLLPCQMQEPVLVNMVQIGPTHSPTRRPVAHMNHHNYNKYTPEHTKTLPHRATSVGPYTEASRFASLNETKHLRNKNPKIGMYSIERTIGKGNFSSVKLAIHTVTGMKVAIKIIDKTKLTPENLQKVYREVDIMKTLSHPNIVTLYQIMETPNLLYIVMEYVSNGELFDFITCNGQMDESTARKKFEGILAAVEHCHHNGVVHRDLKAENLLLDSTMNVKLADFGFGTFCDAHNSLLLTWCGSPPYAAPEIFLGEPYLGAKSDIWSLGVVLYVMVCGALPFGAQSLPELKEQVISASFRIPYWLSMECEKLIRAMLSKSPNRRPSIKQIREHEWFIGRRQRSKDRMSGTSSQAHITPSSSDSESVHSAGLSDACDQLLQSKPFAPEQSTSGRLKLYQAPLQSLASSTLSIDLKRGRVNDLILQTMASHGMQREQILASLERRAYDHLTATYLLLGERMRPQRRSLPQTFSPQLASGAQHTPKRQPEHTRPQATAKLHGLVPAVEEIGPAMRGGMEAGVRRSSSFADHDQADQLQYDQAYYVHSPTQKDMNQRMHHIHIQATGDSEQHSSRPFRSADQSHPIALQENDRMSPYENDASGRGLLTAVAVGDDASSRRASDGGGVLSPKDAQSMQLRRTLCKNDRSGGVLRLAQEHAPVEIEYSSPVSDRGLSYALNHISFVPTGTQPQLRSPSVTPQHFAPYVLKRTEQDKPHLQFKAGRAERSGGSKRTSSKRFSLLAPGLDDGERGVGLGFTRLAIPETTTGYSSTLPNSPSRPRAAEVPNTVYAVSPSASVKRKHANVQQPRLQPQDESKAVSGPVVIQNAGGFQR